MSIVLTPINHNVLSHIIKNGPLDAQTIANDLKLDRGRVEGAIAVLEDKGLVNRDIKKTENYILTKRGKTAVNTLVERLMIDKLLENPISMKDMGTVTGLSKGDVTAGIGILRKANLIKIDKGVMSLTDIEKAKEFSIDLLKALRQLDSGDQNIDDMMVQKLKTRGFIEVEEKSSATISSKLSKKKLSAIKVQEEITKLTPQLILSGDWKNVTFKPYSLNTKPRRVYAGRYHPYRQFTDHLRLKLIGLGFEEMKGPLVEQEFWNFDALYAPQDHPAREDTDILLIKNPTHGSLLKKNYVKQVSATHENGWKTGSRGHNYKWNPKKAARLLLRPQGTAISARTLPKVAESGQSKKYFSVARCFRPDQIDATHAVEFDQTEGIICDPSITFRDLLGMLATFATEVAGAKEVRFRPDYYPFTSPSVELSAKHPSLGWIEFGGAGIFRPEVTKPLGIDYPVLAWGLGVGRLFMTKYEISDIRELFSQNIDYLRNEKVSSGIQPEE